MFLNEIKHSLKTMTMCLKASTVSQKCEREGVDFLRFSEVLEEDSFLVLQKNGKCNLESFRAKCLWLTIPLYKWIIYSVEMQSRALK